jgi:hypothetical protein
MISKSTQRRKKNAPLFRKKRRKNFSVFGCGALQRARPIVL